MWKKLRTCWRKEYVLISSYTVITAFIIFAFAYIVMKMNLIVAWVNGLVSSFFVQRRQFLLVPSLHGFSIQSSLI